MSNAVHYQLSSCLVLYTTSCPHNSYLARYQLSSCLVLCTTSCPHILYWTLPVVLMSCTGHYQLSSCLVLDTTSCPHVLYCALLVVLMSSAEHYQLSSHLLLYTTAVPVVLQSLRTTASLWTSTTQWPRTTQACTPCTRSCTQPGETFGMSRSPARRNTHPSILSGGDAALFTVASWLVH